MWKPAWSLAYLLGKTPWDTGITPPELKDLVEGGGIRPGNALDIGCGTGTNVIYLARHGFRAEGVDIAFPAILQARRKAGKAGVDARFFVGDVLRLGLPDGPPARLPVDFILDIGCLHALAGKQLGLYADMLARVLEKGGQYLVYAWGPRRINGVHVGLTPEAMTAALGSGFEVASIKAGHEHGETSYWYFIRRLL